MGNTKATLILGPVLLAMGAAAYYLWLDYQHVDQDEAQNAKREVFGTVSMVQKQVKRKSEESPLWDPIAQEQTVYFQDSIRTAADSSAIIRLKDNSTIELNENSLVTLDKTSDRLTINFKTGDVIAKNTSNQLSIKVNDSTIDTMGADLRLRSDDAKKAKISVTKGKAQLTDKSKIKRDLVPEKNLSIDEKGKLEEELVQIQLRAPNDHAQLLMADERGKYPFTWSVFNKDIKDELLEVSMDSTFSKEKTKAYRAHQTLELPLNIGKLYWRVAWKDKNQKYRVTDARQFKVEIDRRLSLLSPKNRTNFEVAAKDTPAMDFAWGFDGQASQYLFEMATQPQFSRLMVTKMITDKGIKLENLSMGKYFWRVTALGPKKEVLARSESYSFDVKKNMMKGPILLQPDEDFHWSAQEPVHFRWKKLEGTSSYHLHVGRDKELNNIYLSTKLNGESYTWSTERSGSMYWAVEALDNKGGVFARSETRTLNINADKNTYPITPVVPLQQAEIIRDMKTPRDPVDFEWTAEELQPDRYVVMISKSPQFKEFIKTSILDKKSAKIEVPENGNYYWKVVWLDDETANPANATAMSKTLRFKVSSPAVRAPALVEPARNETIEVENLQMVEVKWTPVPEAKKYHVTVEKWDQGLSKMIPVLDKTVEGDHTTTAQLPEGSYQWKVFGLDAKNAQGMSSETRQFAIKLHEPMQAPTLKAPEIK